jgi:iron complex outermembrane receptor protein
LNLDMVRPIKVGLATPLNLAVGAELRRDGYGLRAGEEDSYRDGGVPVLDGPNAGARTAPGAQVFPGFRPGDESSPSRTNVAGYADLDATVATGVDVALAGRAEHYSDFGSTVNGKIALRVQPRSWLALRGAVNTGFRAPSLPQAYFSSTATNFIVVNNVNTPFEVRTFPVGSAVAQALGARPLEPETSFNLSAGVVLNPTRDLSVTVDAYAIDIDDRIVLTGNFVGADVRALLESRGYAGTGGGRYFTNGIDTRTRGLDIVANYGIDMGQRGLLRLTGAFNATESEVTRIAANPTELSSQSEVLFDRIEKGRIEHGQPRRTVALTTSWTRDALALTLHNQRFGRVWLFGTTPALDQTYRAKWLTDLDAAYTFAGRFTVSAGANNLFDVYPDRNKDADDEPIGGPLSNSGIFPYNSVSPFGFTGAFYYVRVAYRH